MIDLLPVDNVKIGSRLAISIKNLSKLKNIYVVFYYFGSKINKYFLKANLYCHNPYLSLQENINCELLEGTTDSQIKHKLGLNFYNHQFSEGKLYLELNDNFDGEKDKILRDFTVVCEYFD